MSGSKDKTKGHSNLLSGRGGSLCPSGTMASRVGLVGANSTIAANRSLHCSYGPFRALTNNLGQPLGRDSPSKMDCRITKPLSTIYSYSVPASKKYRTLLCTIDYQCTARKIGLAHKASLEALLSFLGKGLSLCPIALCPSFSAPYPFVCGTFENGV